MNRITTGRAFQYALLPGIIPRIFEFVGSGFSHVAFYMAYVYSAVNLLPKNHPYLNPANSGRFGVRHVVFEAKRNLVFKRENIDQIIIFFAMLAGIIILLMQFGLLISGLFIGTSHAGMGAYYSYFFVTQNPQYDLAFRMLDLTFGFKDPYKIFNSCAINNQPCQLSFTPGGGYTAVAPSVIISLPTKFHVGLHALFHFYNVGILVVAFMISGYMFTTIVAETAQSGTPFGKRFNGMWAPIRLIVAIALLTPLAFGMNGAQLLTLVIAKWGSGLATNGWTYFMDDLNKLPIQQESPQSPDSFLAKPNAMSSNNLLEFVFVALTCKNSEKYLNRRGEDGKPEIKAYQVFPPKSAGGAINAPFQKGTFPQALDNANNGDIVIRFGVIDDVRYEKFTGHVKPICGEIIFHTKDVVQPGALYMQGQYFDIVADMWENGLMQLYADNIAKRYMPVADRDPDAPIPTTFFIKRMLINYNKDIADAVDEARKRQIAVDWTADYMVLGWMGAGMWYQKIAEYTGSLFSSIFGMPTADLYPEIMEHVKNQRRIQNDFVEGNDRFDPVLSKGNMIEFETERDAMMAQAYYYAQKFWWGNQQPATGNAFKDSIIAIFGLKGLFDMQKNLDVHPLAQLVGVGRSLVESAVTNLGFSFGSGVVGGISKILGANLVNSVALAASSFAGQIAVIGLAIGFILFYILPFLPFIYFFFAAGGWVKGIFEAMVGLPLWAMAHIRIDGEGLPGPAAMNGYFLIFEIMIRPILIVFGLLASIAIFTAQVQILNEIWPLVTSSVAGFNSDPTAIADAATAGSTGVGALGGNAGAPVGSIDYMRGIVDYLFYSIMYAIICYMMAMSSFKLIDLIPNNILRWMGTSVSTFGEHSGDPAAQLVQYSYMGSQMATGPINNALMGIASRARPGP